MNYRYTPKEIGMLNDEIVRLRAALVVAYNRMPTYAFDIDDLNSDRKIVADAIGLPYAPTCIAVEQSTREG